MDTRENNAQPSTTLPIFYISYRDQTPKILFRIRLVAICRALVRVQVPIDFRGMLLLRNKHTRVVFDIGVACDVCPEQSTIVSIHCFAYRLLIAGTSAIGNTRSCMAVLVWVKQ